MTLFLRSTLLSVMLVGVLFLAACQPAGQTAAPTIQATTAVPSMPTETQPPATATLPPTFTETPRPTQLPHPEAAPTSTATELPTLETLDAETALASLFGRDGQMEDVYDERTYVWQDLQEELFPGKTIYSWVLLFTTYQENAQDKAILIAASIPSEGWDCHACSPTIGGAVFIKTSVGWQMTFAQLDITSFGSFGSAPAGQLVQIGAERYGAMFETTYMGQGYATNTLYLIAEVNRQLQVAFNVVTQQGNMAACGPGLEECWSWVSQVEFVSDGQPEFFPLRITSSGTRLENGQVTNFAEVKLYNFDGTTYQEALPASGLSRNSQLWRITR